MSTSRNKYDSIEKIIFDVGLRINNVEIREDIDKMLIFLNTNQILVTSISKYKSLKNASSKDLQRFQLIAEGTGIHWPGLDEDLSLKGFLEDALLMMIKQPSQFVVSNNF